MTSAVRSGHFIAIFGDRSAIPNSQWARFNTQNQQMEVFNNELMTATVRHIAVDMGDNRIFVWGGFSGTQKLSTGFYWDIVSNEISAVKAQNFLSARANARALLHGKLVYIWGGSTHERNANSGAKFK